MIIYGTRGRNFECGGGAFFCPRCSAQRNYRHFEVRQYFTLYFIPLIPLGKRGEYIECTACAGTFAPEMINYDPVVERQRTIETIRRLVVLFLLDVQRCTAGILRAAQTSVSDALNANVTAEEIATDVRNAQQANPEVKNFFKQQTSDFSDEGKLLLLGTIRQILESEGPLSDSERTRLLDVGKAMGLRAKAVTDVVGTGLLK